MQYLHYRVVGRADDPAVVTAFRLSGASPVGEVEEFYGIHLDPDPGRALGELLAERLGPALAVGAVVEAGEFRLAVTSIENGEVTGVDVHGRPPGAASSAPGAP